MNRPEQPHKAREPSWPHLHPVFRWGQKWPQQPSFQDHKERHDPDSSACPGPGRGSGKELWVPPPLSAPASFSVHTCVSLRPRALPVYLCPRSSKRVPQGGTTHSGARMGPLREGAYGVGTNGPVALHGAQPAPSGRWYCALAWPWP